MEIIANNTPVRTSNNFRINNIKIENVQIAQNLEKFKNVKIIADDADINYEIKDFKLKYGNGQVLEDNVKNSSNNVLQINTNIKNENIKIIYTFTDEENQLVNNIEINVIKDANITIIYDSKTNKSCFHNSVIRLNASKGVKANICIINLLNNNTMNFESIENNFEDNSDIKYTIVDVGGHYSVTNYYSSMNGDFSKNDLETVYLGVENQIKDINYIVDLKGKNTNINIDLQGALNGESHKNFKGTIDFKKGCVGAKGDENEFCILLSPKAKSIALPMLLCTEDDVEGNHSTASGKIDEKSLFYIMSRGFTKKEAIKLMVRARFNKIIERINDEQIEESILKEIDRRLG